MIARASDIAAAVSAEPTSFAELLATMHALRFTGTVTLHLLNGQPQLATLGQPLEVRFAEHPANRGDRAGCPQKSLDRETTPAASSQP